MIILRRNNMKHIAIAVFLLLFCFGGVSAGPISTEVEIIFNHPGDDSVSGTASLIQWKWTSDTALAWSRWVFITDTVMPLPYGTADTAVFDIEFPDNGIYWIGANASDEVNHWSGKCVLTEVDLPDISGPSCISVVAIRVTRK